MSTAPATTTEHHFHPMAARILFSAPPEHWPLWRPHLLAAFAAEDLDVTLTDDPAGPWTFDYVVYRPGGPVADFTPFNRLKAVLSLWAGVEDVVDATPATVPLCRMVDAGLTRGMAEWVAGHVLRYHLGIDSHILGQDGVWRNGIVPPLAADRVVGLLGLGEIGREVAATLRGLGFDLRGWSRRPRDLPGIVTASGADGLEAVLREAEILVTLLPATPGTAGLLDARSLALLPPGARLINAGRGTLIDDAALLDALDAGQARPRHPRCLPRRASAPRPSVLGASAGHRHAARRLRDPPGDRLGIDRAEHPPRRGRPALPQRRRSRRRLLNRRRAARRPAA